jgi:DNA-directed RNA polymerase subunit K/omega
MPPKKVMPKKEEEKKEKKESSSEVDESSEEESGEEEEEESGEEEEEESDEGEEEESGEEEEEESDEEEEEESDEEDEKELYKVENEGLVDVLSELHPESKHSNFKEVIALSQIERDDKGNIVDARHRTVPFLTRYETARIIGIRTKQLNLGHDSTITTTLNDGYQIALEEYKQKKIPFILRRTLPDGTSEYWRFSDLEQIYN